MREKPKKIKKRILPNKAKRVKQRRFYYKKKRITLFRWSKKTLWNGVDIKTFPHLSKCIPHLKTTLFRYFWFKRGSEAEKTHFLPPFKFYTLWKTLQNVF